MKHLRSCVAVLFIFFFFQLAVMAVHAQAIVGDLNGDGVVDISDYSVFVNQFFKKGPNLVGDLNKDGIVDMSDYTLLVSSLVNGGIAASTPKVVSSPTPTPTPTSTPVAVAPTSTPASVSAKDYDWRQYPINYSGTGGEPLSADSRFVKPLNATNDAFMLVGTGDWNGVALEDHSGRYHSISTTVTNLGGVVDDRYPDYPDMGLYLEAYPYAYDAKTGIESAWAIYKASYNQAGMIYKLWFESNSTDPSKIAKPVFFSPPISSISLRLAWDYDTGDIRTFYTVPGKTEQEMFPHTGSLRYQPRSVMSLGMYVFGLSEKANFTNIVLSK